MRIVSYYHIGCFYPNVDPILDEYFAALASITEPFDLRIGLVGAEEHRASVIARLHTYGIPFTIVATADEGWEQVTLDVLRQDAISSSEDYLILYAHSKGSFNPQSITPAWRSQMLWWNINNYQQAVSHLENGADAVGIHLMGTVPNRIFGGNFWWTKASVVKHFPKCNMFTRWDAEAWLLASLETIKPDAVVVSMNNKPIGSAFPVK